MHYSGFNFKRCRRDPILQSTLSVGIIINLFTKIVCRFMGRFVSFFINQIKLILSILYIIEQNQYIYSLLLKQ